MIHYIQGVKRAIWLAPGFVAHHSDVVPGAYARQCSVQLAVSKARLREVHCYLAKRLPLRLCDGHRIAQLQRELHAHKLEREGVRIVDQLDPWDV